jgi:hypothetical protein
MLKYPSSIHGQQTGKTIEENLSLEEKLYGENWRSSSFYVMNLG